MESGISILITYMKWFLVQTAVWTTNIITQSDYSYIAKGADSVCSINNSTWGGRGGGGGSLQGYH